MSKLMLFDFLCSTHGLFEDLVNPAIRTAPCPKCGRNASREISAVRIDKLGMAMSDSASPESVSYFKRVHAQRKAIEARNEANHDDYGKPAGCD